jgi:hypothetical protein
MTKEPRKLQLTAGPTTIALLLCFAAYGIGTLLGYLLLAIGAWL